MYHIATSCPHLVALELHHGLHRDALEALRVLPRDAPFHLLEGLTHREGRVEVQHHAAHVRLVRHLTGSLSDLEALEPYFYG